MEDNNIKPDAQVADEQQAQKNLTDPFEYLQANFKNAPTRATIEAWKAQSPNGIVRLLNLGKRAYIVRGITGMELTAIHNQIPDNLGANLPQEQRAAKVETEVNYLLGAKCILWTSTTVDGKLTPDQLRSGSAGLPETLATLVMYLSDFIDPRAFDVISGEL